MSICFLSAMITMSKQVVLSAVAQRVIIKFLTNEKVKSAEVLMRFRAQFGDEMLSRTQVYGWSKSFTEGRTELGNVRRLHLLRRKFRSAFFLGGTIKVFIDFLTQ
jgi:hypothetical protein